VLHNEYIADFKSNGNGSTKCLAAKKMIELQVAIFKNVLILTLLVKVQQSLMNSPVH